jgi:hypothetical protein
MSTHCSACLRAHHMEETVRKQKYRTKSKSKYPTKTKSETTVLTDQVIHFLFETKNPFNRRFNWNLK